MSRFAVFISIVLSLYAVLNVVAFLWLRFMFRPAEWKLGFFVLFFAVVVIMQPLGYYLMATRPDRLAVTVMQTGFVWLGYLFYFFLFGILTALVVLMLNTASARGLIVLPEKLLRNGFPVIGGLIIGVLTLFMIAGVFVAQKPVVRTFEIPLQGNLRIRDPIKIVQLTDTHLDKLRTVQWWESVVTRTNDLLPDIIVLTGDIIDENPKHLNRFKPGLAGLTARYGVFAVTGNHEFYVNTDSMVSMMKECGITVLRNEVHVIPEVACLIGIDDPTGIRQANLPAPDFHFIRQNVPADLPVIALSHQPVYLDDIRNTGTHLMLIGHTHNGQIWPFGLFVRLAFPYSYGYRRFKNMHCYVSSGTGIWGPPFRIGTRSEISVFILHHANGNRPLSVPFV